MLGGLVMSLAVLAQTPPECVDPQSTLDMNACVQAELDAETVRMNRYLEAAVEQAEGGADPAARLAWLTSAQRAWEAYAGIVCDDVLDQWRDGTIRTVMYLGCRSQMIRERTRVIWREHLTFVDATPPLLPEPIGPALDEAALNVAQSMKFSPAMNRDRRVNVWVEIPIVFTAK